MKKLFISIILFVSFFNLYSSRVNKKQDIDFSKTYSKIFKPNQLKTKGGSKNKPLIWKKENVFPFTELIFSWNVLRPKKGYFSFYVSVKHISWSGWYKIADWGQNKQETFVNTKNTFVALKHVRMELKKKLKSSGYRIKVVPRNGANITDLKALHVCLSDMNKFQVQKDKIDLQSFCIKGVRAQSQMTLKHLRHVDFCSPTSLSMIINFLKHDSLDLKDFVPKFADLVHDNCYLDIYGNWILNTAQAFNEVEGGKYFKVERLNNFDDLYKVLRQKHPVAVSVRGYLPGGMKSYDNGHFILIVGWNNKKQAVLCIDPAFSCNKKTLRAYKIKHFLRAWGRSRNLSYVVV